MIPVKIWQNKSASITIIIIFTIIRLRPKKCDTAKQVKPYLSNVGSGIPGSAPFLIPTGNENENDKSLFQDTWLGA